MKSLLYRDFYSPFMEALQTVRQGGSLPKGLQVIGHHGTRVSSEGLVHVVSFQLIGRPVEECLIQAEP